MDTVFKSYKLAGWLIVLFGKTVLLPLLVRQGWLCTQILIYSLGSVLGGAWGTSPQAAGHGQAHLSKGQGEEAALDPRGQEQCVIPGLGRWCPRL